MTDDIPSHTSTPGPKSQNTGLAAGRSPLAPGSTSASDKKAQAGTGKAGSLLRSGAQRNIRPASSLDKNAKGAGRPRGDVAPKRQDTDDRPRGAVAALIDLDQDLMKLLARRATLISRIRNGRDHAGTPATIRAEKTVRVAWEANSLAFSRDSRFTRQLFSLLQDLKVMTREQAQGVSSFTLSPPSRPTSGVIAGPADSRTAQMRIALSAFLGKALDLHGMMLSGSVLDTLKLFTQVGVPLSYKEEGVALASVSLVSGPPLSFTGRTLYCGEDLFTLYLTAFLGIGKPGVFRLTGGSRLKGADLSALRQVLPLFGARLAHVVPHSHGLPVNIESSGLIPPVVVLSADLPFEGLCALLLAPLVWAQPVILNLAHLPAATATAALAEIRPLHRDCNAEMETHGSNLEFTPELLHPPHAPALPLDPTLCAYLLAIPAFVGGSLTLKGLWPKSMPEACAVEQLLAWAGLSIDVTPEEITVQRTERQFLILLQANGIATNLAPLFFVLAARCHKLTGTTPPLAADIKTALACDFFDCLGMDFQNGQLKDLGTGACASSAWSSPDPWWGMAFALAAFLRSGLKLANPANIGEVMPTFWSIYNSLPHPLDPARPQTGTAKEETHDKPVRRRILAD